MLIAHRVTKLPMIATLALASLLAAGCGKKIAAVCETKCANAADIQTCTTASDKAEATAEERGCEGEFEDYASCLDASGTCTKGVLDGAAACATPLAALNACIQ